MKEEEDEGDASEERGEKGDKTEEMEEDDEEEVRNLRKRKRKKLAFYLPLTSCIVQLVNRHLDAHKLSLLYQIGQPSPRRNLREKEVVGLLKFAASRQSFRLSLG